MSICVWIIIILCILFLGYILFHSSENYHKYPKVAIATMTKQPVDFSVWLDYHLNQLNVNHIFLRVENTPELEKLLSTYDSNRVTYVMENGVNNKNTYDNQQDRQNKFLQDCIKTCKQKGIDFLLHIDDDELFMISSQYKHIQDFFYTIPENIDNIHFINVEAVYPNDQMSSCFSTNKFINCSKGGCKSYANGKSAGLVTNRLRPRGPHYFNGKSKNISINHACVLHFESCNFDKWYQKFSNLSNLDDKVYNNIPFNYYKNSIDFIKNCFNKKNKQSCKIDAKNYWKENKIDPYHSKSNLITIDRHIHKK